MCGCLGCFLKYENTSTPYNLCKSTYSDLALKSPSKVQAFTVQEGVAYVRKVALLSSAFTIQDGTSITLKPMQQFLHNCSHPALKLPNVFLKYLLNIKIRCCDQMF